MIIRINPVKLFVELIQYLNFSQVDRIIDFVLETYSGPWGNNWIDNQQLFLLSVRTQNMLKILDTQETEFNKIF